MQINNNHLLAQMQQLQSIAQNAVNNNNNITNNNNETQQTSVSNFSTMFSQALGKVNELQTQSSAMAKEVEMGTGKVSLPEAMIASQKSGLAFQAAVQVRNKVVTAYQEVFNMPV